MTAIQLIGNIIFFTIGLIVGASIMYFGGLLIDRREER